MTPEQKTKKFKILCESYRSSLPSRISQLESIVDTLKKDPSSESEIRILSSEAHELAGSGGSFGFAGITKTARQLQSLLTTTLNNQKELNSSNIETIESYITQLKTEEHKGPDLDIFKKGSEK